MSLLKERHGVRPTDFPELAGLLQKRFGSSTRVDRARADLRNIRQAQSETVRSYSTRFEALLSKLPSFDAEWAKTQFIWGLHQRVAELVVIAKPGDLAAAINQAEHIEMARNFASGNIPSQKTGTPFRGRGGFMRGRGRFNAVQSAGFSNQTTMQGTPSFAAQQQYSSTQRPVKPNQCIRCK
ncbi:MAG: retrotransposon gag domain-containing protein, partial [Amphritea sp.]|nr:retrotransposon gag domain-containing protein [Amphritea sp.]